jgi:hypothetical protein
LWKDRTSLGISMARICSKCLRPQLFGAQLYATAEPLVENLVGDLKTSREVYVFGTLSRLEALVDYFAMTSELSRYRASPRAVVESKFGAILRFLMRRCRDSRLWPEFSPASHRGHTKRDRFVSSLVVGFYRVSMRIALPPIYDALSDPKS